MAVGDTLTVHLPAGTAHTRTITGINGRVITVGQPFTDVPMGQSIWAVESSALQAQVFRVLSVSEDSSAGQIKFTITATQHNASTRTGVAVSADSFSTLALIIEGNFGGGMGLRDGSNNIGWYSTSGHLCFGFGTNNGALTEQGRLTNDGKLREAPGEGRRHPHRHKRDVRREHV